ncbi:MAG: hypothetical protein IT302_01725 [Dehalococcoidia bacterium]|nr:hypothetical protein [Dehalococcoidia bacterium]
MNAPSSLWLREELNGDVREIAFSFQVHNESVPGLLILPRDVDSAEHLPLVLIQHPGMSSKDDYFVRDVAIAWAKRGWACAGIDAPLHGDRDTHDPMSLFRYRERYPEIAACFAREISATIDQLAANFPIDTARLGYVGYSLGSMLGVPAVAADGRFRVAAFCLVGEGGLAGSVSEPDAPVRTMTGVAVRVVAKLSDELISRAATEALYAAFPGEKDIVWLPGGHYEIGPDVIKAAGDWLKAHL